jgi:hypothetical protein
MAALAAGVTVGALGVLGVYPMHFASFAAMLVGPLVYIPLTVLTRGSQYGLPAVAVEDETPDDQVVAAKAVD